MLFQFNKLVFRIPYHADKTLLKVAILEFIWPHIGPVLVPREVLYFPQAWQKDNLVQRKYGNYVTDHQTELRKLITEIKPV